MLISIPIPQLTYRYEVTSAEKESPTPPLPNSKLLQQLLQQYSPSLPGEALIE
nr:hypothetical protein Q903MT_gene1644 [Picea sitchensis]